MVLTDLLGFGFGCALMWFGFASLGFGYDRFVCCGFCGVDVLVLGLSFIA